MKKTTIEIIDVDKNTILFKCEVEEEDYDSATEYLFKGMNKGQTLYPYASFGQDDRSIWFRLRQFREGMRWGYPLCCIIDYCFSERPGWKYGSKKNKGVGVYIPCRICYKKS